MNRKEKQVVEIAYKFCDYMKKESEDLIIWVFGKVGSLNLMIKIETGEIKDLPKSFMGYKIEFIKGD